MDSAALFNEFPRIESSRLILAEIGDDSLDDLFAIYSNDRVFQYCGILPRHNKETVSNMIGHFRRDYNKQLNVKMGIFLKNDLMKLTGIIEIFQVEHKVNMVTLGYFLAEEYWGMGIATEAVRMVLPFLFGKVNVNRVQADVMPANEPSKRVLLKNGFIKEGMIRQGSVWTGKGLVDLEIYGILKSDYLEP